MSSFDSIEATELAGIRASDGKVSRVGSELRIQLLNGRFATFRDDTTLGGAIQHFSLPRYAGYLKAIHSHVVHEIPYEGAGGFLIVDDSTGDSTAIAAMPVVSPDGTRFVVTSMAGAAEFDAGLIEVWRMVGRTPKKEFSYDTEHESWGASGAVWRDSVTIDFVKKLDRDARESYLGPGLLIRSGSTWALTEVSDSAHASSANDIDTLEAAAIRPVSGIVSRVGTELRIRLLNGRTANLKDNTTEGLEFALPRYAGYLKAIHSHMVHQYQYEGEGIYFVVDDSTGDSTMVFGMPVVSPDSRRFAVTSIEGMEGGNPGVIEVWRIIGRRPEKEFSYNTENDPWEASDPVWRDSVTIDFFKNSWSSPADPPVQKPGHLKRSGGTWGLVDSAH